MLHENQTILRVLLGSMAAGLLGFFVKGIFGMVIGYVGTLCLILIFHLVRKFG